MKPEDRRKRILELLQAMQKELRVEDLAEMLQVSQLTIRRDLDELTQRRTIIRTHGGCLAVGRAALETEYHTKVAENFELKRAIGAAAAERVEPGQHIGGIQAGCYIQQFDFPGAGEISWCEVLRRCGF